MSVYFIANLKIKNEEGYQEYQKALGEAFPVFPGEYLALDRNPLVLEGKWDYNRLVLIEFPDQKSFANWYNSPEYQNIVNLRTDNAICDIIVSEGKE